MVPSTVGETRASGYAGSAEVDLGCSAGGKGHLEEGTRSGRAVAKKHLVGGRSLEPGGESPPARAGNSLVARGKGVVIAAVEGQGVAELPSRPVAGTVRTDQYRSVRGGSAARGVRNGRRGVLVHLPPGVQVGLQGDRKIRDRRITHRVDDRQVRAGGRVQVDDLVDRGA